MGEKDVSLRLISFWLLFIARSWFVGGVAGSFISDENSREKNLMEFSVNSSHSSIDAGFHRLWLE